MNNYVDKRMFTQKRAISGMEKRTSRSFKAEKDTPLTRCSVMKCIFLECARFAAAIFLLFLSTFGGEGKKTTYISVGNIIKKVFLCIAILLVLWGLMVVSGRLVEAVTALPIWSLIVFFAMAVLAAVGFVKE